MSATDGPIVVGVDGSAGSQDALRWAAGQAKLTGAPLRVVAAWRWPNYVTRIPPGADLQAETTDVLHQLVEPLRAEFPEVDISEHVLQGPAGPALLTCTGHAIACRLYFDNPVITATADSMELF